MAVGAGAQHLVLFGNHDQIAHAFLGQFKLGASFGARVNGKDAVQAIADLSFSRRRIAGEVKKVLQSAVANAENNHDLTADSLHVKEANVSDGPSFRRYKPRARGSASAIKKRTSHIYIVLTDEMEVEEKPGRQSKSKKKKAPKKEVKPVAEEEEAPEEVEEETPAVEEAAAEEAAAEEEAAEEVTDSAEEAPEEETTEDEDKD